jgi:hypothetical protein
MNIFEIRAGTPEVDSCRNFDVGLLHYPTEM